MTVPGEYFDQMYAANPDPWGFTTRWYEQRKYVMTLAALPAPSYTRVLEVGCSIGVLTAQLARRSTSLTAMDPSAAALATARSRVSDEVRFVHGAVPQDWPKGPWDLVVLSEVGYYLDAKDLEQLLDLVDRDLAPDGTVVACHWRHPVPDYPQTGDAVHAALSRWPRLSRVEEADFLLDVLCPHGVIPVAAREGLT